MPKMYVANCTNQEQVFIYRLPEVPAPRTQNIPIGRQTLLSGHSSNTDLTGADVDAIIAQHAKYGFKSVTEVEQKSNAGERPFVGLVYSDKPISIEKIRRALLLNQNVLILRGRENRKAAAVAASDAIMNQSEGTPLALKALDLQVEEAASNKNPNPEFNEGVRVSSEETDSEAVGKAPRGSGKRNNK